MSELKIDNPAQRLLEILESGKRSNNQENCRDVWRRILVVTGSDEQTLITRLAKVMQLPARISQVMNDHFPAPRWKSTHWQQQIDKAFYSQELNGIWQKFNSHIDAQTLSELGLLSMTFETRGAHSSFNSDHVETLLLRIRELHEEIRNSELSVSMKSILLRQLYKIQEALESYSISGIEPVMDAVQSTLGLAVIDAEYREEISKGAESKFGEKMSDLLSDVANMITIAGALPALPVAIHTALTYLSK